MADSTTETGLQITVDGTTYTIRLSDLSAIDAKDFRREVGISLTKVMAEESSDLDVVAGLVWLARRQSERGLTYQTVANSLTYGSQVSLENAADEVDTTDPE